MARLMLLLLVVAPMILISQAGTFQNRYTLKVSKNGKDFDERVKVDARKNSEIFHLQLASSGKDAGDIIYDFDKKLTMIRVPEAKSCFLSDSMTNVPRPADLIQLLKLVNANAAVKLTPQSEQKLKVVGKLSDRWGLSNDMADLCANLTIYQVTEGAVNQNDADIMNDAVQESDLARVPAKRTKRKTWRRVCKLACTTICYWKCSGWKCHTVCGPSCRKVCDWVFG